jgi:hypothetical protein
VLLSIGAVTTVFVEILLLFIEKYDDTLVFSSDVMLNKVLVWEGLMLAERNSDFSLVETASDELGTPDSETFIDDIAFVFIVSIVTNNSRVREDVC